MLSTLKIRLISLLAVAVMLIGGAITRQVSAADILNVYNDMNSAVTFWLLSEQEVTTNQFQPFDIRRGETKRIALSSPDRFFQAVTDQAGNEYQNDPLALHQMIQRDPNMRLVLDGDLRTVTETKWVYDPCNRRWRQVPQQRQVRVATILRFKFSNGQEQTYYMPVKPR